MKTFLIVACLIAVAAAEAGSGYGAPAPIRSSNNGGGGGYNQGPAEEDNYQSQTFKHVYVHVAPDEPTDVQSRTIRVPGGDKHVNIIFVKAPSSSSQQNTEVILPEQDEHKNLVYVLLKKGEATSDVKIRKPAAPRQTKPDVYFIRYKDQEQSSGYGAPGGAQGAPISAPVPVRTPSSSYGAF